MVAVAGTSVASAVNPGVMLGLSNPGLDYARSILVSYVDPIARPSTFIHCICICVVGPRLHSHSPRTAMPRGARQHMASLDQSMATCSSCGKRVAIYPCGVASSCRALVTLSMQCNVEMQFALLNLVCMFLVPKLRPPTTPLSKHERARTIHAAPGPHVHGDHGRTHGVAQVVFILQILILL
jgi:hypothetical protein